MTLTRTQAGKTPKKTEHPGYVQTPGTYRRSRSRKSEIKSDESDAPDSTGAEDNTVEVDVRKTSRRRSTKVKQEEDTNGHANGQINGPVHGQTNGHIKQEKGQPRVIDGWTVGTDPKIDTSGHYEFGGSLGVTAIMMGFPALMYYMWAGATYYDGLPPLPKSGESYGQFLRHLGHLIYTGAYPSLKAWTIYWVFFVFQMALYIFAPGIWSQGKPLPHEGGKRLDYYCSGLWSWWITIVLSLTAHFTGVFKLNTIMDEFGPLMSVAIISGTVVSIVAYFSALARGKQHRMTGSPIYDFFMGAELNPRMFGILDFKMFFEVRLPWFILFLTTLGACTRQYEEYGYVSGNLCILLLAHWLYTNACAKGEELIVTTWDMYYEKWGFMLIFWNMAGVPLSYCHCTIYLANHDPKEYGWSTFAVVTMITTYLFVYWVWDTTNSQKNRFRIQEQGGKVIRKAFPQLPWGTLKNPKTITTPDGGTILVDGWYGKARKIHYTCDLFFALTWGAVTGFNSPFPWFYPVFFTAMIIHRAIRDVQRCRKRYGEAWLEYERQVPYLFIPYVV